MRIRHICFNPFSENTYILVSGQSCAVVDPGFLGPQEEEIFFGELRRDGLAVETVLLTHAHFDHIAGVEVLQKKTGCKVYLCGEDIPTIGSNARIARVFGFGDRAPSFTFEKVSDGSKVTVGDDVFEAVTTPGHTPGSVCWLCRGAGVLFSGDTLMAGTIGRTDLEGGDYDAIMASITEKLLTLDGDIEVLPGHGPSTTILREGTGNPFLEVSDDFRDSLDEDAEPIELHA